MTPIELMKIVKEHNRTCYMPGKTWIRPSTVGLEALAIMNEMPFNVPMRCKQVAELVPASVAKISGSLHALCDLGLVIRDEVDGEPIEVPLYWGSEITHWVTPRIAYYTRIK